MRFHVTTCFHILLLPALKEAGKHLSCLAQTAHGQQWLHFSRKSQAVFFSSPWCLRDTCAQVVNIINNGKASMAMKTNCMQLHEPSLSAWYRAFQRLSGGVGERIHHEWDVPPETRQKQPAHAGLVWPETGPWWLDCNSETSGRLSQLF